MGAACCRESGTASPESGMEPSEERQQKRQRRASLHDPRSLVASSGLAFTEAAAKKARGAVSGVGAEILDTPETTGDTTKSPETFETILNMLKNNYIFKDTAGGVLEELARQSFVVLKEPGDVIIRQGDPPSNADCFYYVESGEFQVTLSRNGGEPRMVAKCEAGASFGDLGLLYQMPRQATVTCTSPARCWAVSRPVFCSILLSHGDSRSDNLRDFLRAVPLLQHLSDGSLQSLSERVQLCTFKPGEVIFKQGDRIGGMYIIRQGEVKLSMSDQDRERVAAGAEASGKFSMLPHKVLLDGHVRRSTEFIGETELLSENTQLMNCIASAAVTLVKVLPEDFHALYPLLVSVLKDFIAFNGLRSHSKLSELTIEQLSRVVAEFELERFDKGSEIMKAGESCQSLYFILQGTAAVELPDDRGVGVSSSTSLSAYGCFGSLSTEDNCASSTVVATSPLSVLKLPLERLQSVLALPLTQVLSHNAALRTLQAVETLSMLNSRELEQVAENCDIVKVTAGTRIITQDEKSDDKMYFVKSGEVMVSKKNEDQGASNREKEIMRIGRGGQFGERAMLKNAKRAASVYATTDAELLSIGRATFEKLLLPVRDVMEKYVLDIEQRKAEARMKFSELEVGQLIGHGQFSACHLVRHKLTGAFYALKQTHKAVIVKLNQVERVKNERWVLEKGESPFLVKIVRSYKDRHSLYMLLELVNGGEIFDLLLKHKRISIPAAVFYAACVVLALEAMHKHNIVYRDLKPENLMLDSEGYIRIVDFGFAKYVPARTFSVVGTPEYMSPEIAARKGHGKEADYWSLGVFIYELLVGWAPWTLMLDESKSDDIGAIFKLILTWQPEQLPVTRSLLNQNNSKHAISIIRQFMTVDPSKRLGTKGFSSIKNHNFFSGFQWDKLARRMLPPPYTPEVKGDVEWKGGQEALSVDLEKRGPHARVAASGPPPDLPDPTGDAWDAWVSTSE